MLLSLYIIIDHGYILSYNIVDIGFKLCDFFFFKGLFVRCVCVYLLSLTHLHRRRTAYLGPPHSNAGFMIRGLTDICLPCVNVNPKSIIIREPTDRNTTTHTMMTIPHSSVTKCPGLLTDVIDHIKSWPYVVNDI